jgi:quercetin dioxygenase-like cupin family protein
MNQTPSLTDLPITHHFGGGVYSKETHVAAGLILVQHKHENDHLSILPSGTVELLIDGVRSELTGSACLTIKAGKHHGVKALTDVVWFCIHATDCSDASEVDEVLIADPDKRANDVDGGGFAMSHIQLLRTGVDVAPMREALAAHPELWDMNTDRTRPFKIPFRSSAPFG